MSKFIENERTGRIVEYPPYKCKLCGMYEIKEIHDICPICGWEDDGIQNNDHNYEGGANHLSYNQYQIIWNKNRNDLLKLGPIERLNKIKELFPNVKAK
ncbi:MAG TPA: CPCC family cysteine-rich protein [Clostridia bacterium]|nr:CPCC family cysteine-rich protein [Clostridia bacterium]